MSADDFQSKYASVMESMLKSAVAETTKLFQTMVDELKAEISSVKKENEDLKIRCIQFEKATSRATDTGDSEPRPGQSHSKVQRDTAVQCDPVPSRTMLVEHCQPWEHSSLQYQEQQCCYEDMQNTFQEHNYVTTAKGNSQTTFTLIKQKGECPQEFVLIQEEVEPTVVDKQVLNDNTGSPLALTCGVENERDFIDQKCMTEKMHLPQRHEEKKETLKVPCFGMDKSFQGALENSPVQLHAICSESGQKISEIGTHQLMGAQHQSGVETFEKMKPSMIPQLCQRKGNISVIKQTDVTLQQSAEMQSIEEQFAQLSALNNKEECDKFKKSVAGGEAHPQPESSAQRRRRRPSKKAKHLKKPGILIIQSSPFHLKKSPTKGVEQVQVLSATGAVNITSFNDPQSSSIESKESPSIITRSVHNRVNTAVEHVKNRKVVPLAFKVASLSRNPSEKETTSTSQKVSKKIREGTIKASSALVSFETESLKSPKAQSVSPRKRHTSVTLQDAMLLVEAMNQSTVENGFTCPEKMAATQQLQCASSVDTLHPGDVVPAESQTMLIPVGNHKDTGNVPLAKLSTTEKLIKQELGSAATQCNDPTPTNEHLAHIEVAMPVTLCNTRTSSKPSSTASTQTNVHSLKQHPPYTVIPSVAPSKQGNAVSHNVILPTSVSSTVPHTTAAVSPTKLPTVVSTVAAEKKLVPPAIPSTTTGLPLGILIFSSLSSKTIHVKSQKTCPVVTSQLTQNSNGPQSETLPPPKVKIIVPRQASALASRKHQSPATLLTSKQKSVTSASSLVVSSSQLISSSQELSGPLVPPTNLCDVTTIQSLNLDKSTDNLKFLKQTASEKTNAPIETCSSLNFSVEQSPTSVPQAVSPVIRLTRLPFQISTQKSVSVSKVATYEPSGTNLILKEGTILEKPSTQPLEILGITTDISSDLKETSLAVSCNASKMSEISYCSQEKASVSPENFMFLEKFPDGRHANPSIPPVLEKSIVDVNTTKPSMESGMASERTSKVNNEFDKNFLQDDALLYDPPIEEKISASVIQLTSTTSLEKSEPHLQMSKTQFLAQLAVTPVVINPKKVSFNDLLDVRDPCAETGTSDKKSVQKNTFVTKLRSHLKARLQARRTETTRSPCTEMETNTAGPKTPTLEEDNSNEGKTTDEPLLISPRSQGSSEHVASQSLTTNQSNLISPRRSGLYKNGVRSKRNFCEPTFSRSMRSYGTSETTPMKLRKSSVGVGVYSNNKISTSVSPKRSSLIKETSLNTTNTTFGSPTRAHSSTKNVFSKEAKNPSVEPRRTGLRSDVAEQKNSKAGTNPSKTAHVTPMMASSYINNNPTSVTPSILKNGTSPKVSTKELIHRSHRSSKRNSPVRWPELDINEASPQKTQEYTPAKKHRLSLDGTSLRRNPKVTNSKKLAKATKAVVKLGNSKQLKLSEAKMIPLAKDSPSSRVVKTVIAKAVWFPPKLSATKTPPAKKRESKSRRSQNHSVVFPASVSLHPIPLRGPPVVSPLQPLSVIGWRLLKNQCGECGRVFSCSSALESHVSQHRGHKPFSCTLCGKQFPDSKCLKRHDRVHRNGRIHICKKCGKGFVYTFGLTKHLKMVHGRIKPFTCKICNKTFFTKREEEAHTRIHTGEKPFHCNLCERKFTRRVELNMHLRWHNGEKRHWCPYCGKGFLDSNNLKRHKYIHTGEKPHSCPHCPKHFTQSGHLKKHVKNVHKIQ